MNKVFLIPLLISIVACGDVPKKKISPAIASVIGLTDSMNTDKPKRDTVRNPENSSSQSEVIAEGNMDEGLIQKAVISSADSILSVFENIRADYRIFGYQRPDTTAKKLIFFSVFTNDVKGNPHECKYGSYYSSAAMQGLKMKFIADAGDFVKVNLMKDDLVLSPVFFEKSWVEFRL